MNNTELALLKVRYTKWVDPDIDEAAFWRQCAAVAEIDPNWLSELLRRRKTTVIDEAQDEQV